MIAQVADIPVDTLWAAARRPEVAAAMRDFYDHADRLIAEQGASCENRGRCCRFGQFGHRLYVTALEVVYYLAASTEATASPAPVPEDENCPPAIPPITEDACPHALAGRCHARPRRPLGCRIFFCDPRAHPWQGPLTETLLRRLRTMHAQLAVPYFYADWIAVLRAIRADSEPAQPAIG